MTDGPVTHEVVDGVAWLTIDRPVARTVSRTASAVGAGISSVYPTAWTVRCDHLGGTGSSPGRPASARW